MKCGYPAQVFPSLCTKLSTPRPRKTFCFFGGNPPFFPDKIILWISGKTGQRCQPNARCSLFVLIQALTRSGHACHVGCNSAGPFGPRRTRHATLSRVRVRLPRGVMPCAFAAGFATPPHTSFHPSVCPPGNPVNRRLRAIIVPLRGAPCRHGFCTGPPGRRAIRPGLGPAKTPPPLRSPLPPGHPARAPLARSPLGALRGLRPLGAGGLRPCSPAGLAIPALASRRGASFAALRRRWRRGGRPRFLRPRARKPGLSFSLAAHSFGARPALARHWRARAFKRPSPPGASRPAPLRGWGSGAVFPGPGGGLRAMALCVWRRIAWRNAGPNRHCLRWDGGGFR